MVDMGDNTKVSLKFWFNLHNYSSHPSFKGMMKKQHNKGLLGKKQQGILGLITLWIAYSYI
jgi:hypothetical protein